jgi:hypothetical protein
MLQRRPATDYQLNTALFQLRRRRPGRHHGGRASQGGSQSQSATAVEGCLGHGKQLGRVLRQEGQWQLPFLASRTDQA